MPYRYDYNVNLIENSLNQLIIWFGRNDLFTAIITIRSNMVTPMKFPGYRVNRKGPKPSRWFRASRVQRALPKKQTSKNRLAREHSRARPENTPWIASTCIYLFSAVTLHMTLYRLWILVRIMYFLVFILEKDCFSTDSTRSMYYIYHWHRVIVIVDLLNESDVFALDK